MDAWGVKCNVSAPTTALRKGALCWVIFGEGMNERLYVVARSRGGRHIKTWIGIDRLANFRAAWLPEHLRPHCWQAFSGTRDAAEDEAARLNGHLQRLLG